MSEAAAGAEVSQPAEVLVAAREHLRPGGSAFKARRSGGFTLVAQDEDIARLIVRIAETSLQTDPALAELVSEAARHGHADFFERVNAFLIRAGRYDVAAKWFEGMADTARQFGEGMLRMHKSWAQFLAIIIDSSSPRDLTPGESRRLDEFADFVATLRIGESYAGALTEALSTPDDVKQLVRLTITLGGFEPALLAAEARLANTIEERSQDSFRLAYDAPNRRPMSLWQSLHPDDAHTLIRLLGTTEWIATVAADALGTCPFEGIEAAIESRLASMPPMNRLLTGNALLVLDRDMESIARRLFQAPDPFVRRIAGYWYGAKAATGFLRQCLEALVDLDGGVRDAAIDGLAGGDVSPDILAAVERVAAEPVGFTCLRCEAVNESDRDSCAQCNLVGPEPQAAARKLLEALRASVSA